jgi:hypothetical protein
MAKRYGIDNINMTLIVMYEHFMPNAIVDKSVVNCCKITRNIKVNFLIANMPIKNVYSITNEIFLYKCKYHALHN